MAVGKGRSYGVEFLARKESGRTTGWIGYTLSWSDRRFDEIDNGRRFPARYDNRHKLNIVVSHKLSEGGTESRLDVYFRQSNDLVVGEL